MPLSVDSGLPNYNSPRELKAFLEARGLGMRKRFGQNFLVNPQARAALLDALELKAGDGVWEIGPGLGAMTAGLLDLGASVTAFEIDPSFAAILRGFFASNPAFRLVEGDVLKTWPSARLQFSGPAGNSSGVFLSGNLPYNIAAALLADFIEKGCFFPRAVVTVQREVAERMAAVPGSPDYSSFSVLCASVYKVKLLHVIKGSCFYPAPRIDSQGVRLDLLPRDRKPPALFYPLVRGLFSGRRKTVKNTLSAFAARVIMEAGASGKASPGAGEAAAEALKKAGIQGDRRPGTMDGNEFAALAASLEEIIFYGR